MKSTFGKRSNRAAYYNEKKGEGKYCQLASWKKERATAGIGGVRSNKCRP